MTREFWNKEYKDAKHLTLSTDPSSDLLEFVKWAERNAQWPAFPKHGHILDIGCGNGRNIIPLCFEFNMNGTGFDIAEVALEQARKRIPQAELEAKEEGLKVSPGLKIDFIKQGAEEKIPCEDQSVDVVLDMMVSHQLVKKDREALAAEIARITKPYGWVFFKTFVLEGDAHARRMIEENGITKDYKQKHPEYFDIDGNPEINSYIHPHTKGFEHVYTEQEIIDLFVPYFKIYKMKKSYKHIKDGKAFKRRTVSVYMERLRE